MGIAREFCASTERFPAIRFVALILLVAKRTKFQRFSSQHSRDERSGSFLFLKRLTLSEQFDWLNVSNLSLQKVRKSAFNHQFWRAERHPKTKVRVLRFSEKQEVEVFHSCFIRSYVEAQTEKELHSWPP